MRPIGVDLLCIRISIDFLDVARFNRDDKQCAGLVGKSQVLGIRRPLPRVAVAIAVFGYLAGFATTIGLSYIQLVFAGRIREVGDPASVRTPHRKSFCRAIASSQISRRAVLCRRRPDIASGLDHNSLSGWRDVSRVNEIGCIDSFASQRRSISWHGNRYGLGFA